MPRPRTSDYWRHRVFGLLAQPRTQTAIQAHFDSEGAPDRPSYGTIKRLAAEWRVLPDKEKELYRTFFWPQAMVQEALPWEATPYALELLREFYDSTGLRPQIRVVRWFYRVSLAAPEMHHTGRLVWAAVLAVIEARQDLNVVTRTAGLEWMLAYAPWRAVPNDMSPWRRFSDARKSASQKQDPTGPQSLKPLPEWVKEDPESLRLWALYIYGSEGAADSVRELFQQALQEVTNDDA